MRIVTGLLIVAVAGVIAVGGLMLVQRLVPTERRKEHNDVADFIYAVLGISSRRVASCNTAYCTKYHRYADSYVTHGHPEARATTTKLLSR